MATGEALEDGYRIHARLRTIGTTAPTLAYAAGPGSCAAVGFTGESNLSMDLSTDFLTLDLQADCTSDSPGYIWAAQTWTPDKVHGAEIGLTLASAVIVVAHFVTLKIAAR